MNDKCWKSQEANYGSLIQNTQSYTVCCFDICFIYRYIVYFHQIYLKIPYAHVACFLYPKGNINSFTTSSGVFTLPLHSHTSWHKLCVHVFRTKNPKSFESLQQVYAWKSSLAQITKLFKSTLMLPCLSAWHFLYKLSLSLSRSSLSCSRFSCSTTLLWF